MPVNNGHITAEPLYSHVVDGPDYLTGEQVAALLQVSVKSVQRWASTDPSMPVLRLGRTVRFPRERLIRWLRAREQGAGRSKRFLEPLPSQGEAFDNAKKSLAESALCAHS
jgi:excisionase family DNA binding protein